MAFDMKLYDRQVGVFGVEACVATWRSQHWGLIS
jgi:hypothetical protein